MSKGTDSTRSLDRVSSIFPGWDIRAALPPGRADRLPSTYPRNQLDEEGVGKPTTMRVILSRHSLSRRAIPFCGRAGLYG
jgi:hypothetical protein